MDGDMTRAIWLFHQIIPTSPVSVVHQLLEYWCNFPTPGYGIRLAFSSECYSPPPAMHEDAAGALPRPFGTGEVIGDIGVKTLCRRGCLDTDFLSRLMAERNGILFI